ncbi:MAG TPA: lysophospholipid acyltransferase family protein [Steroidobacteraceae bacterium]|nr:lysophospholipid acyltransferase family protein [Steroidobacteraceae bacterium]
MASPTVPERIFSVYCLVIFALLAVLALTINLFLPSLRARRRVAGAFSRAFFRAAAIPLRIEGMERLPAEPCVVVANHASYIDGIVAAAALPPDFAFVIKKEMVRVPLASLLLRRLGSAFVERFDRHKGGADARRVWKLAATGQSLVFFPEGTFAASRQVGRFLGGAFATAERSNMPIVAAAIQGTRDVLPAGGIMVFRRAIRFAILEVLEPKDARERSRELIAQAVGEPLAP